MDFGTLAHLARETAEPPGSDRRWMAVGWGRDGGGRLSVVRRIGRDDDPDRGVDAVASVPVGWTTHAAARFAERDGGDARAAALAVGVATRAVMALVFAEAALERAGPGADRVEVGVPCGRGLLVGIASEADAGGVLGLPPVNGGERVAAWTAATYLGPRELDRGRRSYAGDWSRIAATGGFEALADPAGSVLVDLAAGDPTALRTLGRARTLARMAWPGMAGSTRRRPPAGDGGRKVAGPGPTGPAGTRVR